MPKYRFEFLDEPGVDPVVLELADEDAARTEARRAMTESALDEALASGLKGRATKIYDEAGYLVATVDSADFEPEADRATGTRLKESDEPGVKRSG